MRKELYQITFIIISLLFFFVCIPANADNIYVSASYDNIIYKYDSSGNQSVFASGLSNPQGLAFDSKGNLYVINHDTESVDKFDSGGNRQRSIITGLIDAHGLVFDKYDNLYIPSGSYYKTIYKYDLSGNKTVFASEIHDPTGFAFDSYGNLYVSNNYDTIFKFDSSGNSSIFAKQSWPSYPFGLAFDRYDYLYVANSQNPHYILKYDLTGNKSIFSSLGAYIAPCGLAFDSKGNLYASCSDGSIRQFNSSGQMSLLGSQFDELRWIAVQPIPEPASAILIGAGFFFARIRHRKR